MYEAIFDIACIAGFIFILGGIRITALTFFDSGPSARSTRTRIGDNPRSVPSTPRRIP